MRKYSIIIFAAAVLMALAACTKSAEKTQSAVQTVDLSSVEPLSIERLDQLISQALQLDSPTLDSLTRAMAPGLELYLRLAGDTSAHPDLINGIIAVAETSPVKVFSPDVNSRLGALDSIELCLGGVRMALNDKLPSAKLGRVFGVVSPFRQGIITSDSVALVALNLYLGPDYPGYQGFEEYFRATRVQSRIPYDLTEAVVASAYPADFAANATVLQRMLYQGALVKALMEVMPKADLATAVGVTPDQLKWLSDNEPNIWKSMIDKDLLYSTSRLDASRLLDPAPNASIIHSDAPARLGRYMGYRIVESYLREHPETSLETLLSPGFYNGERTLIESDYNP